MIGRALSETCSAQNEDMIEFPVAQGRSKERLGDGVHIDKMTIIYA